MEYSDKLLEHAEQLYNFAVKFQGNLFAILVSIFSYDVLGRYDKSIKDAHDNYPSTDYQDELVWAGVWLHLATGDQKYLDEAEARYDEAGISRSTEFSWDDKVQLDK